jgi:putative transposase
MLQAFLLEHQIKMGRDALFDLLAANRLLIKRKKRRITTTQSFHRFRKYANLIKHIQPASVNQVWVSDITYYRTTSGFVYISFITDAYSRKIVGYHVANTLEAIHTVKALMMAIKQASGPLTGLIHHSDRGIQYCCIEYVNLLQHYGIAISMTENGDPLENAIAERLNGIIKVEFLNHYSLKNQSEVMNALNQSVTVYNTLRPHMSCAMLTPDDVHQNNLPVLRTWKNYYKQKPTFVNPLQDLNTPVNL